MSTLKLHAKLFLLNFRCNEDESRLRINLKGGLGLAPLLAPYKHPISARIQKSVNDGPDPPSLPKVPIGAYITAPPLPYALRRTHTQGL